MRQPIVVGLAMVKPVVVGPIKKRAKTVYWSLVLDEIPTQLVVVLRGTFVVDVVAENGHHHHLCGCLIARVKTPLATPTIII